MPRRGWPTTAALTLALCSAGLATAPPTRAQAPESAPGEAPAAADAPAPGLNDGSGPWQLGAKQEFSADTNLFRAPDGQRVRRDITSTTSLLVGLDQPLGRQRLGAELSAGYSRYKNNTQLDGSTYALTGRLDWATVGRLSGLASVYDRASLFRYDLDRQQTFTGRTQLRSRGAALQARLGVVTAWSLEAGLTAAQDRYSRAEFRYRDLRQAGGDLGLRWQPSEMLSARVGVRRIDGRYPHYAVDDSGAVQPDDFQRDDVELSLRWKPNDKSQLRARLNRTREQHDLLGARDGSGWTGELAYDWQLTGKTGLILSAGRESSVGGSRFDDDFIVQDSSDARRSNRIKAQLRYDATSKIRAEFDLQQVQRTLDDSFVLTPQLDGGVPIAQGDSARDRLVTAGLRLRYQASRGLLFGCSIGHERRSTSDTTLTYPYRVSTGACFGQLTFM